MTSIELSEKLFKQLESVAKDENRTIRMDNA